MQPRPISSPPDAARPCARGATGVAPGGLTAPPPRPIMAAMNVLALQASPRRRGNTVTLARALLEGLKSGGVKQVSEVFLDELAIRPCNNCEACRRRKGLFCVFDDGMTPLYPKFIEADLVVLASPVYWWSVSAQLKLFIDRLYGLNFEQHPERYKGKKLVLVFTHQEEHPCSGAELARRMFEEIADYTEMSIAGDLRYSSDRGHVRGAPKKLAEARALGAKLARP
jgi:multimeric flavodoxin WrbA